MHRISALAVLLLLVLASPAGHGAMAAVREFGPSYARFTVDVPDGWFAQEIEHGVSVTPSDSTSFLALTATRARGDAKAEASWLAREMGLGQPREERPGIWTAAGTVTGSPALCRVSVKDGFTYAATLLGRNMASLEAIAASFTPLVPVPAAPAKPAPALPGETPKDGGASQNGARDAGPATFGPAFHRFTVKLPEGWTAEATESGLVATPPGGKAACFLEMQANAEHLDSADLARAYARDSGLSQLTDYPAGSRAGRRCLSGLLEGEPALACAEIRGRHYLGLVAAGRSAGMDRLSEEALGLMDTAADLKP